MPENKKRSILEHQFAFITFKDPKSASRVVNEFTYLRLNDKKYNEDLAKIIEAIKSSNLIEER